MNGIGLAQTLDELLQAAAREHHHLCPRQVLGVRMGLLAGEFLGVAFPRADKRVLAFVETDGCVVDGIAVASGCRVGRRTMHIFDFGKVAATFVDVETRKAARVLPSRTCRDRAWCYAPEAADRWHAQLLGYQRMPAAELLRVSPVLLTFDIEKFVSKDGYRVECQSCGEDIINEREMLHDGAVLCRSCAGRRYYQVAEAPDGYATPTGAAEAT